MCMHIIYIYAERKCTPNLHPEMFPHIFRKTMSTHEKNLLHGVNPKRFRQGLHDAVAVLGLTRYTVEDMNNFVAWPGG